MPAPPNCLLLDSEWDLWRLAIDNVPSSRGLQSNLRTKEGLQVALMRRGQIYDPSSYLKVFTVTPKQLTEFPKAETVEIYFRTRPRPVYDGTWLITIVAVVVIIQLGKRSTPSGTMEMRVATETSIRHLQFCSMMPTTHATPFQGLWNTCQNRNSAVVPCCQQWVQTIQSRSYMRDEDSYDRPLSPFELKYLAELSGAAHGQGEGPGPLVSSTYEISGPGKDEINTAEGRGPTRPTREVIRGKLDLAQKLQQECIEMLEGECRELEDALAKMTRERDELKEKLSKAYVIQVVEGTRGGWRFT